MTDDEKDRLLRILAKRFDDNVHRHAGVSWSDVRARLESRPEALRTLAAMEASGGEPDVVGPVGPDGEVTFCDCSAQSPPGRRSLCYDRVALEARKKHKPTGSAVEAAAEMGVELLSESRYRELQTLGELDTKTSSWILTPADVRERGGALFCDRRYGRVFTYHNGAESYYAARGFRGELTV